MISFHSLEDRIVKTFIQHESRVEVDRRAPFAPPSRALRLQPLGRIKPSEGEVRENPRRLPETTPLLEKVLHIAEHAYRCLSAEDAGDAHSN